MKTYQPTKDEVKRQWHLINADNAILGRMATQIAAYLMGKHKSTYSNHMDSGDYVVVINAGKVKLGGKKLTDKVYYKHSGYPGGFREVKIGKLLSEKPEEVIFHAVAGMLPKNRLHDKRMRRLKVFNTEKHPFDDKFKSKVVKSEK